MCRLLETIKIKDNAICNLAYHNARTNRSRRRLFGCEDAIDCQEYISLDYPKAGSSLIKCRLLYRSSIESVEYFPYRHPVIRSLKIVRDDFIDYSFKYENRQDLSRLFALRTDCDDILIVKQGLITDTSFCNVVCWDGRCYLTPARPLLPGTARARLLDEGRITADELSVQDLALFKRVFLVNSMIDLDDQVGVDRDNIVR